MGCGDYLLPGAALSSWDTHVALRPDASVPCLNQTSETIQVPLHALYPHLPTPTLSQSHHNLQSPQHLRGHGQNPYKALGPTEPTLTNHRFQCTGHQETEALSKVTGGESLARNNRKKALVYVSLCQPCGPQETGLDLAGPTL